MVSRAVSTQARIARLRHAQRQARSEVHGFGRARPAAAGAPSRSVGLVNRLAAARQRLIGAEDKPAGQRCLPPWPLSRAPGGGNRGGIGTAVCASIARSSICDGRSQSAVRPLPESCRERRCATQAPEVAKQAKTPWFILTGATAALGQKAQHGGRRLLDRTARHVDRRPIVLGAEPARKGNFLRHRGPIDILVVVAMRLQTEQTVLADLHDALRARIETDNEQVGQVSRPLAPTARRAPAARCRSLRRDWRDRSRSASSRCATPRPRPHRLPRDLRRAGRRHASS